MKTKHEYKQLPEFKSEDEERKFWSTHDTADYFDLSQTKHAVFPNLKPTTRSISLRLNESLIQEIKILAHKKNIPYQSLIKVYLSEKVKEEAF
ncbi:MAG TPA: BrnA antitoxin family protein [Candidatus Deferrimicrobium sp.]|nr:BrnA antitoxin family protein [Candidatus Kapabacteria bacterium]HLP60929.1 BrnA antitoxin family protein [Candidatus Deferrimicrobium sp.]